MGSSPLGYLWASIAILGFGSNYVVVKKYETHDGMFFQWVMCAGIWCWGLMVQFVLFGATKALTEDDENNLMSGLLAKRLGAPRAACIVHRHAYTKIYRQLGIDVAISPRQIAADHILGFVRPASVESLVHLGGETAQVMEIIAALDSPITSKPVAKLSLSKGVSLGGIVSTEGVRVPTGDDRIEPGDTVVVLYLADQEGAVKKLFKRSLF